VTFSAVRTTGIYCRPGCGARPRADNVRTFEMAAAAEAAGYRACLRCRPYRVGGPLPQDASELVCRGVQLIIAGVLDTGTEADLAARLGFSARHLRRLFVEQLGATPDQLARSRRAHFARRLLDDTELDIVDVAFASGFGSVRQFNDAMRTIFRATPRELRARRRRTDRLVTDGGLVVRLPFREPYDWPQILAVLERRAIAGVESVTDGVYRRSIALDGSPGVLELAAGGPDHLLLRAHLPYWEGLIHVVERAARIAGVDDEVDAGRSHLAGAPSIAARVTNRPGLRLPAPWSGFEAALSVVAGPDETAALVRRLGEPVAGLGGELTHLFPSPAAVAGATTGAVRALALAAEPGDFLLDGRVEPADLDFLPADDVEAIALRLGHRDAFPAARLRPALDALGISAAETATWQPWRGLATTYLISELDPARAA